MKNPINLDPMLPITIKEIFFTSLSLRPIGSLLHYTTINVIKPV